jgi:hypothetical protein
MAPRSVAVVCGSAKRKSAAQAGLRAVAALRPVAVAVATPMTVDRRKADRLRAAVVAMTRVVPVAADARHLVVVAATVVALHLVVVAATVVALRAVVAATVVVGLRVVAVDFKPRPKRTGQKTARLGVVKIAARRRRSHQSPVTGALMMTSISSTTDSQRGGALTQIDSHAGSRCRVGLR